MKVKKELELNVVCANCGKAYHLKPYQLYRNRPTKGFFCSRQRSNEFKKTWFRGENNHQFGLKGEKNASFKGQETYKRNHRHLDIKVYAPNHPFADANGRVKKQRLLVEENYQLFDEKYFVIINGKHYLPNNIAVHHKDLNHNNNAIENLEPLTKGEHTSLHNRLKTIIRDENGKLIASLNNIPNGIKIMRTEPENTLPKKAHRFDAAFDVYNQKDIIVPVGRSVIPLGFRVQMPLNCAAYIKGRSGNDSKGMLDVNGERRNIDVILGLIDPQYTGEVGLIVVNREQEEVVIGKGDRIGKILFFETVPVEFVEVDSFEETERNSNGFGSSGIK